MITFTCPKCDAKLKAIDERAGTQFKCGKCGNPVQVPALEERAAKSKPTNHAGNSGRANPKRPVQRLDPGTSLVWSKGFLLLAGGLAVGVLLILMAGGLMIGGIFGGWFKGRGDASQLAAMPASVQPEKTADKPPEQPLPNEQSVPVAPVAPSASKPAENPIIPTTPKPSNDSLPIKPPEKPVEKPVEEGKPADSLTEMLQQEVGRRMAQSTAFLDSRKTGNQTSVNALAEAQKKEREALIGKKVEGTVIKVTETSATRTYKAGEDAITMQAHAAYRVSDPVLFRLKAGQEVHVEGTVVTSFPTLVLKGCLFGTEAERKEAGSGAIKDPVKVRQMVQNLMIQVSINQGRVTGMEDNEASGRVVLEDLILNCPDTPEAKNARMLLDKLAAKHKDKAAKDAKPLDLSKMIAREAARKAESKEAWRTGNSNLVLKVEDAHAEEQIAWNGRQVNGTATVSSVGGGGVMLVASAGTREILAKAKDEDDPLLVNLKRGDVVKIQGFVDINPAFPGSLFAIKDCVFTAKK